MSLKFPFDFMQCVSSLAKGPYHRSGAIGDIIASGRLVVSATGEATQLTTTSTPCLGVWLSPSPGNSDYLMYGDSSITAATASAYGATIYPGNNPTFVPVDDVSLIYVDAKTAGDAACFSYVKVSKP